jgi:hypothetical protein
MQLGTHQRFGLRRDQGVERDYGRILLGLVVAAVGTVYLLDGADVLDGGRTIDDWWPAVIVAVGAFQLAERPRSVFGPLLVMAAGGIGLLFTTGALDESAWAWMWPIGVIVAGLFVMTKHTRAMSVASGQEILHATGIFGGQDATSNAQAFRGASLTAVFGGVVLDLRHALPAPEGARVNATAVFGGIDVLVPRGWNVAVNGTPIFGGVGDKTDRSEPLRGDAPRVTIDALVAFGGVEVKHEK